jgi:hypothetical protein
LSTANLREYLGLSPLSFPVTTLVRTPEVEDDEDVAPSDMAAA